MKKTKKSKKNNAEPTEEFISPELAASKEYAKYVKEQRRRLRELERIASGMNMVGPAQ